jgi:hypothetical protein
MHEPTHDYGKHAHKEICAIVSKYLKQHPERWNEPAFDLVIDALKQSFSQ